MGIPAVVTPIPAGALTPPRTPPFNMTTVRSPMPDVGPRVISLSPTMTVLSTEIIGIRIKKVNGTFTVIVDLRSNGEYESDYMVSGIESFETANRYVEEIWRRVGATVVPWGNN